MARPPATGGRAKVPAGMVHVGRIGAAHGIAGAVRVKPFTAKPEALASYGLLTTGDGRELHISALRAAGSVVIVQFDGLSDRAAAEGLKGIDLFVPRERLPAPDEDEYYHADLIGLDAISSDGKSIGKVVGVENYGAGDLIEIAREKGSTVLIPFTRANVPKIELTAGRLVVDPPPGLLD